MTPKYRAYHPGTSDDAVMTAELTAYPVRTTEAEAVADLQRAWHNPGGDKRAVHLVVYRIDGDSHVTPTETRVRRRIETRAVG